MIAGFVPDLDPCFTDSTLAVIPARAAGLEGIQAQPGRDVLVADRPADFADAVIRLLSDKALQTQLSTNGRCLVESNYDCQVILKDLDNVYRQFA